MFDKNQYQSNIGTGIAFLFNRNLQLNSSFRLLADGKSSGYYSSFGASYRLNRHVDKVINLDKKGKSSKKKRFFGKKGFLNNLTSKFKNLFRKKQNRISTKKSNLKKETIQSIKNNSSSNEENSQKKSLRTKPLRKRVSPSKIKIEKDKSKKGFFNILKKREKDEKQDSEKNAKELEKEIKDLEIGIYNWTLDFSEKNNIIKNWENEKFLKTYKCKAVSIISNLDPNSYLKNINLHNRLKNNEFKTIKINKDEKCVHCE